jgi:oligoribonuclease NrnB/cAMP/cGMP phosphodiesterase (DHH superfamily)
MLTEKQREEIKEHLERAQNPLFYYDNDADGLCSYVLIRRALGKGKGVAVRSFPGLDKGYARKARELGADYVFVLDKPEVEREFFSEMQDIGIPVVWIDHHDIKELDVEKLKKEFEGLFIYNWAKNIGEDKSSEPVTYGIYKTLNRKEDIWLAVAGCVADHFLPDFVSEFKERYKEYWGKNVKEPFDALFDTEIGKIGESFNFGLKDSTTNIVKLQNFLISVKGPGEVFEETSKNYEFRKKYKDIKKKLDSLLRKAEKCIEGDLLFFAYSGDLSISSEISNRLNHKFGDKIVVVAFKNQGVVNISMRGKGVREILHMILESGEFDGASGGGHEMAVGARIKLEDLENFEKKVKEKVG